MTDDDGTGFGMTALRKLISQGRAAQALVDGLTGVPLDVVAHAMRNDRCKSHLGDGLYASLDNAGHIWLRCERDGRVHEVALDYPVQAILSRYKITVRELLGVSGWDELPVDV